MAPASKVSFEERIEQLIKYEADNGHMFVPQKEGSLGKWVNNMRFTKSKLKKDQIDKLNEVGFVWVTPKGPEKSAMIEWGKKFKKLVTFQRMKGHCNVPASLGGKPYPLADWCDEQRQLFGEEKLDKDKYEKLTRLGFDFFGSSDGSSDGEEENRVSSDLPRVFWLYYFATA